jgi:hypothetical protein
MAVGTSVFRIRIEQIFRWCWNLITLWGRSAQRSRESAGGPVRWQRSASTIGPAPAAIPHNTVDHKSAPIEQQAALGRLGATGPPVHVGGLLYCGSLRRPV